MTALKYMLVSLILHTATGMGWTQKGIRSCYGFDCRNNNKWSISFFAGYPLLAPGKETAGWIITSGAGDLSAENRTGDAPVTLNSSIRKHAAWSMTLRKNISRQSAVEVMAGRLNAFSMKGYWNVSGANVPAFRSDMPALSVRYVIRTGGGSDGLSLGGVLARHSVTGLNETESPVRINELRTGIQLGYLLSLVRNEHWFLALQGQYTWLPAGMQNGNLGLTTGWRF